MSLLSVLAVVLVVTSTGSMAAPFSSRGRPRLRLVWHSAAIGLCVLVMGAVAIAGPTAQLAVPGAVRLCVVGWATEGPIPASLAMAVRATAALALGWLAAVGLGQAWRRRGFLRRHRADLAAVAMPVDATVCSIDHPESVVYCLGGRRPVIVTTTAATERLSVDELRAVIAHERAHLAGHHAAVRAIVEAIATAWPWLPAARAARREIPVILECVADDAASREHAPASLARAICRVAAAHPRGTLGAGGHEVLRATRLCGRHSGGAVATSSSGRRAWTRTLVATIGAMTTLVAVTACST